MSTELIDKVMADPEVRSIVEAMERQGAGDVAEAVLKKTVADSTPMQLMPDTPYNVWWRDVVAPRRDRIHDAWHQERGAGRPGVAVLDVLPRGMTCRECGRCCQALPAEVASPHQGPVARTFTIPLEPGHQVPEEHQMPYGGSHRYPGSTHQMRIPETGGCSAFCNGDCTIYEKRPRLCRIFHPGSATCRAVYQAFEPHGVPVTMFQDFEIETVWGTLFGDQILAALDQHPMVKVPFADTQEAHDAFVVWLRGQDPTVLHRDCADVVMRKYCYDLECQERLRAEKNQGTTDERTLHDAQHGPEPVQQDHQGADPRAADR